MGYFGNGFVFTTEPDWHRVAQVFPETVGLAAHAHPDLSLWLLDAWACTRRDHFPFTDPLSEDDLAHNPLEGQPGALLESLRKALEVIAGEEDVYGDRWLAIAATVALETGQRTFFFAGDDEVVDAACAVGPGGFERFALKLGRYLVEGETTRIVITSRIFEEDDDESLRPSEEVIGKLREIESVEVKPILTVESGDALYGNSVRLWPSDAGDPSAVLGIGTWDPFVDVERVYSVVFERRCTPPSSKAQTTPRSPKWWQFWRHP